MRKPVVPMVGLANLVTWGIFSSACGGGQHGPLAEVTPMDAPTPPTHAKVQSFPLNSKPLLPAEPVAATSPEVLEGYSFELLLDQAVISFALGNGPRISVLSNEPWIFDGQKWKLAPIPKHLRTWQADAARVRIFYGRDNQPRLMGWTNAPDTTAGSLVGVYLRHKLTGWQREPAELGRLGNSQGALYGILGEADPEVVCRPGDVCLIKRVSGWGQASADAAPAWVQMAGSHVFKVTDTQVSQLVQDSWQTLMNDLPSGVVTNVWGDGEGALFLIAGGQLFRKDDQKWTPLAAPLDSSQAIAAQADGAMWLGGTRGLCRIEKAELNERSAWHCLGEKLGAVVQIEVTPEAVFVGSDRGLFRALL